MDQPELRPWIVTRTYYVTAPDEHAAVRAAGGPTLKTVRVREMDPAAAAIEKSIDEHQLNYLMDDPLRREPVAGAQPRDRRRASSKRHLRAAG